MQLLPEALAALGRYRQFITYLVVPSRTRAGKTDKFPTDFRTGEVRDAHDPSIWTDFATASATGRPVGFVFTDADPFWFLDIDNCLGPEGWSESATKLCQALAGCAVEVSQSGKGLHIFGSGALPPHGTRNQTHKLELYHSRRFVALTGMNAVGNADTVPSPEIRQWLVGNLFPPIAGGDVDPDDELTEVPRPEWRGPVEDEELVRRARMSQSAKAAFGTGATFADLWDANAEVLARAYPASGDDAYDRSSADAALAQHLAFWTGAHGQRIERLMRQSRLAREKWDNHDTYMLLTIRSACARQVDVLKDKPPQFELEHPTAAAPTPSATAPGSVADGVDQTEPRQAPVQGTTFLSAEQQAELFKGCIYITDVHGVLVPGGEILKPDQFKVRYGGYTFAMDQANERTVRNAWEAFTESQALRCAKVDTTCFRPDLAPAAIITSGGRKKANVWWPVKVPRASGNPAPFLQHLAKILPIERDAKIMLCYMAACVQHIGIKFQWAPLLQGVEGNGKSFFTECLVNAVGERYTHLPRADQISAQFNSWVRNKLVIGVEDVFVPDQKQETFEILKPMITARRLPVEPKGVDQGMVDVCCNWLLNSNHKDGLKKTRNDRRICPLFCAQQEEPDLGRDGLNRAYFESLYAWYRQGGMAVVNDFLYSYAIDPEFNPATGQIAPITSSTEEAITGSRGNVEQHIQEAIDSGAQGFRGDFVSSLALDKLIERNGASRRITLSRRKELMRTLGYEWHPGLPNGRVNNNIAPDNGRPQIYVKIGSAAAGIAGGPAEVARLYTKAQTHEEA